MAAAIEKLCDDPALRKFVDRGEIARGESVVVVSTAHGLKFGNTKAAYHAGQIDGVVSHHANAPVKLAATREAVYDAIMRHVEAKLV